MHDTLFYMRLISVSISHLLNVEHSHDSVPDELVIREIRFYEVSRSLCHLNYNQLWKPYCKICCIVSTGNSWKRMTCLDKGKLASWSLGMQWHQAGNTITCNLRGFHKLFLGPVRRVQTTIWVIWFYSPYGPREWFVKAPLVKSPYASCCAASLWHRCYYKWIVCCYSVFQTTS